MGEYMSVLPFISIILANMSSISIINNEHCIKKCMKYCYKGKKYVNPNEKIFLLMGKKYMISQRGGRNIEFWKKYTPGLICFKKLSAVAKS